MEVKFYKEALLSALSEEGVDNINTLWSRAKDFFERGSIIMGGSYSGDGSVASIALDVSYETKIIEFTVSIDEVNIAFVEKQCNIFLKSGEETLRAFQAAQACVMKDPSNPIYIDAFMDSKLGKDMLEMASRLKEITE